MVGKDETAEPDVAMGSINLKSDKYVGGIPSTKIVLSVIGAFIFVALKGIDLTIIAPGSA